MSKVLFLIAFMVYATAIIKADKKIVCYYGSWAAYRRGLGQFESTDIDPNLCTHIIYTFVGISEDGNVRILDSWLDLPNGRDGYGKFTRLRQLNPEIKAMIAIGGWNEGSTKYSNVVANPNVRARFVQNVIRFLKMYDFDGFDFDWEYPNQRGGKPADKENYIALLKELREEFDKHGYILSVAVAAAEVSASKSYLISQVSQYPHIINLMAYDLNGSWNNFAAINAPLYPSSNESGEQAKLNVNSSVQYWLAQGAPADKLILGVPAYGRSFTLSNSAYNTIGSSTIGPGKAGPYTQEGGMLGYNEICEYIKQGWTVQREPEQRVPYAFKDNQWVGYDDVISLEEKAKYVMSNGLGGMMMWSVETDDFHGTCGDKYPLLHSINRVLKGYIPPPSPPPSPTSTPTRWPKPDSSTVTRPSSTSSTTALPSSTPSDSICTQEGFVRDPKNCSIFYYCQRAYNKYLINRFHCPSGLVFDTSFNGCNYRYNVPDC